MLLLRRTMAVLAMVAIVSGALSRPSSGLGIQASLAPADTTVQQGATFQVRLLIPQALDPFNGYFAEFLYDPDVLTFMGAPDSVQEGSLMKSACPTRWHVFEAQPGSLSVSHILLCAGVTVTGPGELYVLNFMADAATGTTTVSLGAGTQFFDAGVAVVPVQTTNSTIEIRNATSTEQLQAPRLHLQAAPNPFNPQTRLRYGIPVPAPVLLTIHDLRGRRIVTLVNEWQDSGTYDVLWNGRDSAGVAKGSGVYYTRLEVSGAVRSERLVLLK